MKWWEYIIYSCALGYSANHEQTLILLFSCYFIASVYFCFIKKARFYLVFQWIITVLSGIFIFICPGNYVRSKAEAGNYFVTYGMLDFVDKLDLGLTSSLKWLYMGQNVFVIVICVALTVFVWKKYNQMLIRIVALVPSLMLIALGPCKEIALQLFPEMSYMLEDISQYGLITVENAGKLVVFIQFFIMLIITCIIILEIYLLSEKWDEILIPLILVVSGVGSRVALGFSPTIWASGYRTCTMMAGCIIVAFIYIAIKQLQREKYSEKFMVNLNYIMNILLILGFLNFAEVIGAAFI